MRFSSPSGVSSKLRVTLLAFAVLLLSILALMQRAVQQSWTADVISNPSDYQSDCMTAAGMLDGSNRNINDAFSITNSGKATWAMATTQIVLNYSNAGPVHGPTTTNLVPVDPKKAWVSPGQTVTFGPLQFHLPDGPIAGTAGKYIVSYQLAENGHTFGKQCKIIVKVGSFDPTKYNAGELKATCANIQVIQNSAKPQSPVAYATFLNDTTGPVVWSPQKRFVIDVNYNANAASPQLVTYDDVVFPGEKFTVQVPLTMPSGQTSAVFRIVPAYLTSDRTYQDFQGACVTKVTIPTATSSSSVPPVTTPPKPPVASDYNAACYGFSIFNKQYPSKISGWSSDYPVPPSTINLQPSQQYSATLVFTNTGKATWDPSAVIAGSQNPQDNVIWGTHRITALPKSGMTPPTGNLLFTLPFTAPSQPGSYDFAWRPLIEGKFWFGDTCHMPIVITAPLDASIVATNVPPTLWASSPFAATLTFKNTGTTTWNAARFHLVSQDPAGNTLWGISQVALPGDVPPQGTVTFTIPALAPNLATVKPFSWQMSQDGVGFFGAKYTRTITVQNLPQYDNVGCRPKVLNITGAVMKLGETRSLPVAWQNLGTTTLMSPDVMIVPDPSYPMTGLSITPTALPGAIVPGQTFITNVPVTATKVGDYVFATKIARNGVKIGGDSCGNPVHVIDDPKTNLSLNLSANVFAANTNDFSTGAITSLVMQNVTVKNTSQVSAANVSVYIPTPWPLISVSNVGEKLDPGVTCSVLNNYGSSGISCLIASVSAQGAVSFQVPFGQMPGSCSQFPVTLSANITGSTPKSVLNAGSNTSIIVTTVCPHSDLSVTQTVASAPVRGQDPVMITVTATNKGPDGASKVLVIAHGFSGSVPDATKSSPECKVSGNSFSCSLTGLKGGESKPLTLAYQPLPLQGACVPTQLQHQVQIAASARSMEVNPNDNSNAFNVPVLCPSTKLCGNGKVDPGEACDSVMGCSAQCAALPGWRCPPAATPGANACELVGPSDGSDPYQWMVHGNIRAAVAGDPTDTTLFIGGRFTQVDGQMHQYLAAVDQTNGKALAWQPDPGPASATAGVYVMVRDGNTLYVGGNFTQIAGQPRDHLAAFDVTDSSNPQLLPWKLSQPLGTGTYTIRTMVVLPSALIIGGDFSGGVRILERSSGTAYPWSSVHGKVDSISLTPDSRSLIVGGVFDTVKVSQYGVPLPAKNIVMLDLATGNATYWKNVPSLSGEVESVAADGTYIFAGGTFSVGGIAQNYVALSPATGQIAAQISQQFPGTVHTISPTGNTGVMFVGGHYVPGGWFSPGGVAMMANIPNYVPWNPYANATRGIPADTWAIIHGYSNMKLVLGGSGDNADTPIGVFQ